MSVPSPPTCRRTPSSLSVLGMVVACLLMTAALPAAAADGRVPVYQVTTITQPGVYYLTQDINAGGSTAVTIQSNNVTLDLNGHTISGTGYMVYDSGYTNIHVTNGTLTGGLWGCYLYCSNGRFKVDHLTVLGTSSYGIYAQGASGNPAVVTIEDDMVVGVQNGTGIYLAYVGGGRVTRCIVRGTTGGYPSGYGLYAYSASGLDVEEDTLASNALGGIELIVSSYCNVSHNTVAGSLANNGYGIWLTSSSGANTVDWNTISGGGYVGLEFDSGCNNNEYSYNRARGNTGGGYSDSGTNANGGGNL